MCIDKIRFEPLAANIFSEIAKQVADEITPTERADSNLNKTTQLRKFYDELLMWDEKVNLDEHKYTEYAPFIHMLKAKVAYAKGRNYVNGEFVEIFNKMLEGVKSAKTLHYAKLFFEAVLGFRKAAE